MTSGAPKCVLDRDMVNEDTIHEMHDIALSFFASACGKNRGAFVLDPPDGKTYSCLDLPKAFSDIAGQSIATVEDLKKQYTTGNMTDSVTVELLDLLVQHFYDSAPNNDRTLYACDFNGLTTLANCPNDENESPTPIRAVSMAGVFVPADFVSATPLTLDQASSFYTRNDFVQMANIGLTTVQIPVPVSMIAKDTAATNVLLHYLRGIGRTTLNVMLVLEATDDTATPQEMTDLVVSAAQFCLEHSDLIIGMKLPLKNRAMIDEVQKVASTLPLFLPIDEGEIQNFNAGWKVGEYAHNIHAALELSHTVIIADIASSTSREDRSKMFYHEATSCILRAPLEYAKCFEDGTNIFVSSGFNLASDNCASEHLEGFQDYGQCGRFDETISSPWWHSHRESFAARQLFAYEQGMGWTFSAWKLYGDAVDKATLEKPADLMALKTVVSAGLFPNLVTDSPSAHLACLNPPEMDFILGDDTLSPTAGPPPDCGNGWWDFELKECTYWVPPPTDLPTAHPTIACPVCDDCDGLVEVDAASLINGSTFTTRGTALTGLVGIAIGVLAATFIPKLLNRRNRSDYTTIAT